MGTEDGDRSTLREALRSGDTDTVRLLLSSGVSPHPVSRESDAPRYSGLSPELARSFIEMDKELKVKGNGSDFDSFQIPLFLAAVNGSAECIRLLVEAGADVSLRDNRGRTASMHAATAEAVRALVELGCPIDGRDAHNQSALDESLTEGREDAMRALIEAGADLEARDEYDQTPLIRLCGSMDVAPHMVKALIDAGANVHARTDRGTTALHDAVPLNCGDRRDVLGDVVRVLVAAGLAVDVRDNQGRTPLHWAVDDEGIDMSAVEALISLGADVNAQDAEGKTPLMIAADNGYISTAPDAVRALLAAGADVSLKCRSRLTAVGHAKKSVKTWRNIVADPHPLPDFLPQTYDQEASHREAVNQTEEILALLESQRRR